MSETQRCDHSRRFMGEPIRCSIDAGHEGPHLAEIEWEEDEGLCWVL